MAVHVVLQQRHIHIHIHIHIHSHIHIHIIVPVFRLEMINKIEVNAKPGP